MIASVPPRRRPRPAGRRVDLLGHPVRIAGVLDPARAVELLGRREHAAATFLSTSEITRLNRAERTRVEVSPLLAETLAAALAAAASTDGLVDPVRGSERGRSWREVRLRGHVVERPVGVALDLTRHVLARAADDLLELIEGEGTIGIDGVLAARGRIEVPLPFGGGVRLGADAGARYGVAQRRPAAGPWRELTVAAGSAFDAFVAAEAASRLGEAALDWLRARGVAARLRGAGRSERTTERWVALAGAGVAR